MWLFDDHVATIGGFWVALASVPELLFRWWVLGRAAWKGRQTV